MEEERSRKIAELETASPLESVKLLRELELYDAKSSQEIIDEVYAQFASGENIKEQFLKPVFMSVVDGLLEGTAGGRAARKKGLTASRVLQECEQFSYDGEQKNTTDVNGYTEAKNAKHNDIEYKIALRKWEKSGKKDNPPEYQGSVNENMSQDYRRDNYEDKTAMKNKKKNAVKNANGAKNLEDAYTGKKNITANQNNPDGRRNDPKHRYQAQPDHVVPLKQIHDQFKTNYALDDSDIKRIANIDKNLALTSAEINQSKKERSNKEYIELMDEQGTPLDETTRKKMLDKQKEAEKAVNAEANKTVLKNLTGKGVVDKKAMNAAVEEFKEKNGGRKPTKAEREAIEKNLQKKKTGEIRKTATKEATKQAKDYAVGNLILYIIKPIYYEMSDIFKNGLQEGVGASSGIEAIKIRFGRISKYVTTNAAGFLGDNLWDFVKGFVSSLVEGIISLFVGMLKQILKIIKEGIKIFVQSAKILFGSESIEIQRNTRAERKIYKLKDLTAMYKDLTSDMAQGETIGNELLQSLMELERRATDD